MSEVGDENEAITMSDKKIKKTLLPKGTFAPANHHKYLKIVEYINRTNLPRTICPYRYNYMCYIIVQRKSEKNNNWLYELYHQETKKLIMSGEAINNVIGSKYAIYESKQTELSRKPIGYLRGNLMKNQFILFDAGYNPKKKILPIRKQLAVIKFQRTQLFGAVPIIGKCILPYEFQNLSYLPENQYVEVTGVEQISHSESELKKKQKEFSKDVYAIKTQIPKYNAVKKIYELSFKSLVTEISPYNCIMKTSSNSQCLVIGKRNNKSFVMYLGTPLSLIQGFGYFLANLINKQP